MNDLSSDTSAVFVEGNASLPTRSGGLFQEFSLRLCADRKGAGTRFLPICIALVVCLWLGCPLSLCASDQLTKLDYATALQRGKDTQRPLFIFFTSPWCYQCTEMERKVFQNPEIVSLLNERFVLVEVDISQQKELKEKFRISYTPTSLFLDDRGRPISDVKGYIPTNRFRKLLRYVSEGHYKAIAFSDFEKQ